MSGFILLIYSMPLRQDCLQDPVQGICIQFTTDSICEVVIYIVLLLCLQ